MDERHVVTVFLRNDAAVLVLRRSEAVGSYPGRWGGVAGFAEGDPAGAARAEVREETGIDPDGIHLVRRGDPFAVDDADLGTRWVVHPFLFDCPTREVETDWETAASEWVAPTAILRRETVPDLWCSYDAVRPTVASVRDDREHGSAYLSVRALEVLRDAAALAVERGGTDWDGLVDTARDLRDARDGMAAVRNRVNRAMHEAATGGPSTGAESTSAGEATPAAVEAAAEAGIDRALRADDEAAARAADLVAGRRVLTLSRSGTVRVALVDGDPGSVVVAASRPGGEGVAVAESLAVAGLDVTLTADAATAWLLGDGAADLVLVGADSVLPDGAVVNKVGTRAVAVAADREGVPVYAACATDKIRAERPQDMDALLEEADPADVAGGPTDLRVECPLFDVTPADLLAGVVTEAGVLDADGVGELAGELRSLADWDADAGDRKADR